MISDSNKKLAQWAMDFALKNGCQAARVNLNSGSNSSFELRDAKMDKLQQASENGLSITLLLITDTVLSQPTGWTRRSWNGSSPTVLNQPNIWRKMLSALCRIVAAIIGGSPDLQMLDGKFDSVQPDEKVGLARAIAEEVYGTDKRIISVSRRTVTG